MPTIETEKMLDLETVLLSHVCNGYGTLKETGRIRHLVRHRPSARDPLAVLLEPIQTPRLAHEAVRVFAHYRKADTWKELCTF